VACVVVGTDEFLPLARAQSGGEILDQCANERNENDPGPPPISITGASELSLCKTVGADIKLRDFFPQGEDRSDCEDGEDNWNRHGKTRLARHCWQATFEVAVPFRLPRSTHALSQASDFRQVF